MDWWRYYLETSAAFSRSMHQGSLVERLAEWKLQCSANVFWYSGVIWCCCFSRSKCRGTLVEILEVWKLQCLAQVFRCSGVIWCCCCHYILRFYLHSVALRYSTCSDNAPLTPHPRHLSQLWYHVPFFVSTYLEALPSTTEPFLLGLNWQLFSLWLEQQ